MSPDQDPTKQSISPDQLPPLGPTADVPPIHSDKLNDAAYWKEKYEAETAKVPRANRDDRLDKKPGTAKRVVAGLTTTAILGVGGFMGVKAIGGGEMAPDPDTFNSSASAESGEKIDGPVSIDGLNEKASEKQIQFVINNPVDVRDFPDPREQVIEMGKRFTVVMNSGEMDWKAGTADEPELTPKSAQQGKDMIDTFIDYAYESNHENLGWFREQITNVFDSYGAARAQFKVKAIETPEPLQNEDGVTKVRVQANMWVEAPGDSRYDGANIQDDYIYDWQLKTDEQGIVRLYRSHLVENIGDVDNKPTS